MPRTASDKLFSAALRVCFRDRTSPSRVLWHIVLMGIAICRAHLKELCPQPAYVKCNNLAPEWFSSRLPAKWAMWPVPWIFGIATVITKVQTTLWVPFWLRGGCSHHPGPVSDEVLPSHQMIKKNSPGWTCWGVIKRASEGTADRRCVACGTKPKKCEHFSDRPLRHAKLQPAEQSVKAGARGAMERANVPKDHIAALQDDHNLKEMVCKVEATDTTARVSRTLSRFRQTRNRQEVAHRWAIPIHVHLILTWAIAAAVSGRRYLISPVKSTLCRWCPWGG